MNQLTDFLRAGGITMVLIAAVSIAAWYFALTTWRKTKCLLFFLENDKPDKYHRFFFENEISRLNGRLGFLGTLATALPSLGLLGTVLGMLVTFDVIGTHGTGEIGLFSKGIRKALLTTQAGLFSAIPVMFFHHVISSGLRKIDSKLNIIYPEIHNESNH